MTIEVKGGIFADWFRVGQSSGVTSVEGAIACGADGRGVSFAASI